MRWNTTVWPPIAIFICVVSFIVATLAIKGFIAFLTKYGFAAFGWYRIIVGVLILVMGLLGYELTMD